MITINAIDVDGKLEPERALTPEEKAIVIAMWFFDNVYHYYVYGEEDLVSQRDEALGIVANDIKYTNPQYFSNISFLNTMIQQYPDEYLEQYIAIKYPDLEIFDPFQQ